MRFSGTSPDGKLVEVIELPGHPWFLAVQCHPEFRSKPTQSHPLFRSFIKASLERREAKKKGEGGRPRAAASGCAPGRKRSPLAFFALPFAVGAFELFPGRGQLPASSDALLNRGAVGVEQAGPHAREDARPPQPARTTGGTHSRKIRLPGSAGRRPNRNRAPSVTEPRQPN